MVNIAILIGRCGRDPEVRYTTSGSPVANFSLATDERGKDSSGNWETKTEWHQVQAWGKLAEVCEKRLSKGSLVYVEGRIQTSEWDDKQGNHRKKTEIVAKVLRSLDSRSDQGEDDPPENKGNNNAPTLKAQIWQKMTTARMPQADAIAMWEWAERTKIPQLDLLKNFDNFRKGWENYKAAQTQITDDDIPF